MAGVDTAAPPPVSDSVRSVEPQVGSPIVGLQVAEVNANAEGGGPIPSVMEKRPVSPPVGQQVAEVNALGSAGGLRILAKDATSSVFQSKDRATTTADEAPSAKTEPKAEEELEDHRELPPKESSSSGEALLTAIRKRLGSSTRNRMMSLVALDEDQSPSNVANMANAGAKRLALYKMGGAEISQFDYPMLCICNAAGVCEFDPMETPCNRPNSKALQRFSRSLFVGPLVFSAFAAANLMG